MSQTQKLLDAVTRMSAKDELLRRALRLLEGPGHLVKDRNDLIRDIKKELPEEEG